MGGTDISAWSETALITVTRLGAAAMQFAARVEDIDIDIGDKNIEWVNNLKGGRIAKKVPQGETSITFTGYPYGIGQVDPISGFGQLFWGATTYDITEPMIVNANRMREQYQVAIMWTDDTTPTSALAATASGKVAERFIMANCYLTGYKLSYTDQILKATLTFKGAPFNKEGVAQMREESTEGTTVMSTLNTYNTTNFVPGLTTGDYTW